MHLPPLRAPPLPPLAGRHPPHRKNRERRQRRGSNGDASVKRRSGVRRHAHRRSVRVRAERDGRVRARARRQLLSPGGRYRITHCRRARDHAPYRRAIDPRPAARPRLTPPSTCMDSDKLYLPVHYVDFFIVNYYNNNGER